MSVCMYMAAGSSCSPPPANEQKGMNLGVRYEIRSRRPIRIKDAQMVEAAGKWGQELADELHKDLIIGLQAKDSSKRSCQPIFDSLAIKMADNLQVQAFRYALGDAKSATKNARPQPAWTITETQILQAYSDAYSQKVGLQPNVQKSKKQDESLIYTSAISFEDVSCKKCHSSGQLEAGVYVFRLPQSQIINYIMDTRK